MKRLLGALITLACLLSAGGGARAEMLRVASGQKGFWDTSITTWGARAGFFHQEGLELEILYTDGGAETQQAVISGGVDIGIGAGILGVAGAAAKGAPVRVICAQWTGAGDLFWYARADGPVQTLADAAGRTAGYSTPGSSSNLVLLALLEQAGVKGARPTATGGAGATLTQVMSGQIDIGWSVPPIALREVDRGMLRIVARGTDAPALAGQTTRVNIANAELLRGPRRDSVTRFMRAYMRTLDWAYSDPQAIQWFAEGLSVDPALARRVRDEFYPKSAMQPGEVRGMDMTLRQAAELRRIPANTTPAQAAAWLDVIAPGR